MALTVPKMVLGAFGWRTPRAPAPSDYAGLNSGYRRSLGPACARFTLRFEVVTHVSVPYAACQSGAWRSG